MTQPKFGPMILAFAILCAMLFVPVQWLYPLISDKRVDETATALKPDVFQGIALQKRMLGEKQILPMYGSSELLRLDPYHPSNYFKVEPHGFTPYLIGRGGTQSLTHLLSFSELTGELRNKKIVYVLSPQWFVAEGLDEVHFAPNYSSLQAYSLVFNHQVDAETKRYLAKRLLSFEVVKQDKLLRPLLEAIVSNEQKTVWKAAAIKPFAYVYKNILERKDLLVSLFTIPTRTPSTDESLRGLSMTQLEKRAEEAAAADSKSNQYGIEDAYFEKHIGDKLPDLRGYKAKEDYKESPEYEDLQMILNLLKRNHTQALFISVPVNGPWYDFAEFPKERRQVYYNKVRKQIEQAGFPVADLSSHEYDRYFMKDTIHVGWKGWVYVDQALEQYMK
ncbi:D-alanyl-lipoteichoic acid biosynthesis protein DltD [Ectobacillus ponti]|uniref:Protein DltD n=1 Tax=Ectobacillus ponti TaxID=2961894 RepID=A0AA41X4G7_9BACI|nr:D-alanyl-lipoteichoic acid biosynthesis protein DltD [Ectobacillus ponti]MCP8968557.1 D-alanyl-lipoteichoic acid biosynthesis protein DltD [Ectobacillus ponti]